MFRSKLQSPIIFMISFQMLCMAPRRPSPANAAQAMVLCFVKATQCGPVAPLTSSGAPYPALSGRQTLRVCVHRETKRSMEERYRIATANIPTHPLLTRLPISIETRDRKSVVSQSKVFFD